MKVWRGPVGLEQYPYFASYLREGCTVNRLDASNSLPVIFDQGCLDLDIVRHHGKRSVCVGHYQTRVTKNVTTKCYNKSDQNKLHFICFYLFPMVCTQ